MSALKADIAYFDAKLSLLREQTPNTYRVAQVKAYQTLEASLSSALSGLDRHRQGPGMGDIQVVELSAGADVSEDVPGESVSVDIRGAG